MAETMAIFTDPFSEIAVVLAVAAGIGAIAFWLRQPLIIAFIFAGILLGPAGLNWVHALDQVDLFAKLGIGLLLFVVGLRLDPHLIRSVGPVAVVAGVGQMTMTAAFGYAIALALGMTTMSAFYAGGRLTLPIPGNALRYNLRYRKAIKSTINAMPELCRVMGTHLRRPRDQPCASAY
jgi:Kef-type K+ transport system membrane component KefB